MTRKVPIAMFLLALAGGVNAHAGEKAGNGGDALAAQFVGAAKNVLVALKAHSSTECNVADDFAGAYERTRVNSIPVVVGRDGTEKDAENDPDASPSPLITVSRSRLSGLARADVVKDVIHEYLSVAKRESSDEYALTTACLATLNAARVDLAALVPPMTVPTSVIDRFLASTALFSCADDQGQFYDFRVEQPHSGCQPYLVLSHDRDGRSVGAVVSRTSPCGIDNDEAPDSLDRLRERFRTMYSIESGRAGYQFIHGMGNNISSSSPLTVFLSSDDQVHWALTLSGHNELIAQKFERHHGPLSMSCVPVYF